MGKILYASSSNFAGLVSEQSLDNLIVRDLERDAWNTCGSNFRSSSAPRPLMDAVNCFSSSASLSDSGEP